MMGARIVVTSLAVAAAMASAACREERSEPAVEASVSRGQGSGSEAGRLEERDSSTGHVDASTPALDAEARSVPEASSLERQVPDTRPIDEAAVEETLGQIAEQRRWKEHVEGPTQTFIKTIGPAFDEWSKVLVQLSSEGRNDEADRICGAIVALRNHLGPKLLPVERYDSFIRDRFWLGQHRIEAAQFFEPVRYYPTDDRIMKIYRLSVYGVDHVVRRYYLEQSKLGPSSSYVLGRAEGETNEHRVISTFGDAEPTYWQVKERTIADLERDEPAVRNQ